MLMRDTPLGGRLALPRAERPVERIWIFITDEKGCFSDFDRRIAEVLPDQFMAGFIEQLPESRSFFGDATLQGALAHAQFPGDHDEVGPATGQESLQHPLHLFEDGLFRATCLQLILKLGRKHLQEFIVVRGEGTLPIGGGASTSQTCVRLPTVEEVL